MAIPRTHNAKDNTKSGEKSCYGGGMFFNSCNHYQFTKNQIHTQSEQICTVWENRTFKVKIFKAHFILMKNKNVLKTFRKTLALTPFSPWVIGDRILLLYISVLTWRKF